jgi:hypothetical protein
MLAEFFVSVGLFHHFQLLVYQLASIGSIPVSYDSEAPELTLLPEFESILLVIDAPFDKMKRLS